MLWLLGLIWLASMIGVVLDKYVYTFPWMGMATHIGGIAVDVSRGWDIDSGFEKRAAGFSRSSISAAMLLPTLALIIAPRMRNWLVRAVMLALTVGAVLLTTQKGALVAVAAVSVILCAPAWSRYRLLALACLAFALLDVALPLLTDGLLVPDTGGVFSFGSFGMRITLTWPEAWHWILHNEVFPFGVGLGGIGGAQRFYAAELVQSIGQFFRVPVCEFRRDEFGLPGMGGPSGAAGAGRGPAGRYRRAEPAGVQPWLRRCVVHAGGPDVGVVPRRRRRHAVAVAASGAGQALAAILMPAAAVRPPRRLPTVLLPPRFGGDSMNPRPDETANNFTLLRVLLALMVVLGHFKLLSGTAYPRFPFNLADAAVDAFSWSAAF